MVSQNLPIIQWSMKSFFWTFQRLGINKSSVTVKQFTSKISTTQRLRYHISTLQCLRKHLTNKCKFFTRFIAKTHLKQTSNFYSIDIAFRSLYLKVLTDEKSEERNAPSLPASTFTNIWKFQSQIPNKLEKSSMIDKWMLWPETPSEEHPPFPHLFNELFSWTRVTGLSSDIHIIFSSFFLWHLWDIYTCNG